MRSVVFAAFLLVLCAQASGEELRREPIPIELGVGYRKLSRIAVSSPDGALLAYVPVNGTKRRPTSHGSLFHDASGAPVTRVGSEIWITDLRTVSAFQINPNAVSTFGPSWSPDGARLAFYSDEGGTLGLWVWDRASRQSRRISSAIARPGQVDGAPAWISATEVVAKFLPEGMSAEELEASARREPPPPETGRSDAVTVVVKDADPAALAARGLRVVYGDLGIVNVHTGAVRRIVRGENISNWVISPDGSFVAYDTWVGQGVSDFAIVSLTDGATRFTRKNQTFGPKYWWSPDGRYLVLKRGAVSMYLGDNDAHVAGCDLLDTRTWKITALNGVSTSDLAWAPGGTGFYYLDRDAVHFAPLLDLASNMKVEIANHHLAEIVRDGRGFAALVDKGTRLVVRTRDASSSHARVHAVDMKSGKARVLYTPGADTSVPFMVGISRRGVSTVESFVVALQDIAHYPDLWLIDPTDAPPRRLTHLNPELDRYAAGAGMQVEWTDRQGRKLKGAALLPAGYEEGRRYPMHVDVYGGRQLEDELRSPGLAWGGGSPQWNYQLLATRGYVVFIPEVPYGENTVLRDITDAVMSGVDRMVQLGIADPEKLSVEGQSFGGYCVRALITQTTRFRAAISTAGASGNVTAYGGVSQHRITADFFKDSAVWIENSPAFFYDRVKTPLLIEVGMEDGIGNNEQTYRDYHVLRGLGVDAQVLQYYGEGHSLFGYRNQIDFWKRRIAWIEH